jgi:protein-L-isoaspartate O-methyltransferase
VGAQSSGQSLLVLEKQPDGTITRRTVMGVRFVPLVDQAGKAQ